MSDTIDTVRSKLRAWGRCINGGLPGGFGQPGIYQSRLGDDRWCPQADEIEYALRVVRNSPNGTKKAEAIRLYYATNLLMHEQSRKFRMTEQDYEVFVNATERQIADILTTELA